MKIISANRQFFSRPAIFLVAAFLLLVSKITISQTIPPEPVSSSPRCTGKGVILKFNGVPPVGESWYWQTNPSGTSTADSSSDYPVTASGTYYLRSFHHAKNSWSRGAASIIVNIAEEVTMPVFTYGPVSTRCQGAGQVTYTANAFNSTGIIYSLDDASLAGKNTINAETGMVTYDAGWSGTTIISATVFGCKGPKTTTHIVNINQAVSIPVFIQGPVSTRFQGAEVVNYAAKAYNSSDITYTLDAVSISAGNTINISTGAVTYTAGWVGTSYVTASANGCNGPTYFTHAARTIVTGKASLNSVAERTPDTDDKKINYPVNSPDVTYEIKGGLTGTDHQDGILGAGSTFKITQLPKNAILYYNDVPVTKDQELRSFNPVLLKIDPEDKTRSASFMYASKNETGLYDPTPATVTVNWSELQPVRLISFSGKLNNSRVDLNWVFGSEYNIKQTEVESSVDGLNFSKFTSISLKGNGNSLTSYDLVDPNPRNGLNYYRLKIVNADGSFEYSDMVLIRIENSVQLLTKVAPNPFTGKVDVYLTLTHNTLVEFRFIDISGRMVFSKSVNGLNGFNWFTLNDLEKLPSAPYILQIVTDDAVIVEKLVKK